MAVAIAELVLGVVVVVILPRSGWSIFRTLKQKHPEQRFRRRAFVASQVYFVCYAIYIIIRAVLDLQA